MVHDFKPPFLDGRTQYSTHMGSIQVVKDPNCDMAILSKKGSAVVKQFRERTERNKIKEKEQTENERLKKMFDKNHKK